MGASVRRNIFQRAVNRVGRPLGILPFPIAWERDDCSDASREGVFDNIVQENYWHSQESVSGRGSELRSTSKYRTGLINFLRQENICSLFDAPCGDLNWMVEVLAALPGLHYIGGDVSAAVLERARARRPDLDLRQFDICTDPFPDCEVWQCRETMLHLSFADIWSALRNAARSNIRYALITTHKARVLKNLDVRTGGNRPIDLHRDPFNFPPADKYLMESYLWGLPRGVGVWPIEAIRQVVERAPAVAPTPD